MLTTLPVPVREPSWISRKSRAARIASAAVRRGLPAAHGRRGRGARPVGDARDAALEPAGCPPASATRRGSGGRNRGRVRGGPAPVMGGRRLVDQGGHLERRRQDEVRVREQPLPRPYLLGDEDDSPRG